MITINGALYDVTYVGNCEIEEMPNSPALDIDPWGMDQCTRTYKGRITGLAQFLGVLAKNRKRPDPDFPALTLANYQGRNAGNGFCEVSVVYKGLFTNALPDPVISGGVEEKTVTLPFILGDDAANSDARGGTQIELTYEAPFQTFRYITRNQPTQLRFSRRLDAIDKSFEVTRRTGASGSYTILRGYSRGMAGAPLTPSFNEFNGVLVIRSRPTYQQAGIYWEVTETNTAQIIPYDLVGSDYISL